MYSTWSVLQLKDALRKRKAPITGKKAALIERSIRQKLPYPDFPALDKFRDVNASTNLPALSKHHIQEFADRFQVPPKGRLLYENRSLVTLRVAFEGSYAYFHAQCKAQMKKLLYIVLVKLDMNGMIEESHCECAAGSGLEAHCKHVFTVLFGLEDIVRSKTIVMYKMCTEKLMTFKKPKKIFFDSPMQAHVLPGKRMKKTSDMLYQPISEENIPSNYENYVQNLAIGFASTSGSKMPYLQVIKPANPYATENDHDYLQETQKDQILKKLLLRDINQHHVENIKANTIQQNASKEWHEARSVRITASNFHAVCHSKGGTNQALVNNILYPKKFSSRATTHGIVNESVALQQYEQFLSTDIERCGLCISTMENDRYQSDLQNTA